jgi:hypothetical protein
MADARHEERRRQVAAALRFDATARPGLQPARWPLDPIRQWLWGVFGSSGYGPGTPSRGIRPTRGPPHQWPGDAVLFDVVPFGGSRQIGWGSPVFLAFRRVAHEKGHKMVNQGGFRYRAYAPPVPPPVPPSAPPPAPPPAPPSTSPPAPPSTSSPPGLSISFGDFFFDMVIHSALAGRPPAGANAGGAAAPGIPAPTDRAAARPTATRPTRALVRYPPPVLVLTGHQRGRAVWSPRR